MRDGGLDAFFFVGGYPTGAISELASAGGGIELVPVDRSRSRQDAQASTRSSRADTIPANTYKGVGEVKTIAVGAQWVTSAKQPDALIYEITKAIWNDNSRKLLDAGHAKGKVDHEGERDGRRRHPVPSGRREVLQGSRPAQVGGAQNATRAGPARTRPRFHWPDARRSAGARCMRRSEIDAKTRELEEKFDPEMRFRPIVASGGADRHRAADRPVVLPLLHGGLRPAARDDASRRPPRVRARPHLPRLPAAQGAARASAEARPGTRPAACRGTTGCCAVAIAVSVLYIPYVFDDLAFRVGNPSTLDVVMGSVLVVLLLEATRRAMGWPLPIIAIAVHDLRARRADLPGPAAALGRVVAEPRQPPVPDEPGHLRHRGRRRRDVRVPLRAVRRARDARSAWASSSSTSRRRSRDATRAGRRRCRCSRRRCSACCPARRSPTR